MLLQSLPSPSSLPERRQFCQDPEGWGPFNTTRADFTPCAEHIYVLATPACIATLAFIFRIIQLSCHSGHLPFRYGQTRWIYRSTQYCIAFGALAFVVALDTLRRVPIESRLSSPTLAVGLGSMMIAWTVGLFANHAEHAFATRSSNYLFLYYLVSIAGILLTISTLNAIAPPDGYTLPYWTRLRGTLQAFLLFNIIGLAIEAYPREQTSVQRVAREREGQTVREQANLLSQLTYQFLDGLLKLGSTRTLKDQDVPNLAPKEMQARASSHRISEAWNKAVAKRAAKAKKSGTPIQHPSLMWTIFRLGGGRGPMIFATRFLGLTLSYLLPSLLGLLLQFVGRTNDAAKHPEKYPEGGPPLRWGLLLAFAMLATSLVSVISLCYSMQTSLEYGFQIRSGLQQMIYLKSLVLSPEARHTNTVGSIMNHMSIDADVWADYFMVLPFLVTTPYELGLALFLLYKTLGISIIAGLAVIAILSPSQGALGRKSFGLARQKLGKMDNRVRLMNEILSGIKIIKLYGWEDSFRNKVEDIRDSELAILRGLSLIRTFSEAVFTSSTLLMSLASFAMYSMIGGPGWTPGKMTADVVFVAIALFGMVNTPIGLITTCINSYIQVKASSDRIQAFLVADEIDPRSVQRYAKQRITPSNPTPPAIELSNITVAWSKSALGMETTTTSATDDETQPLLANGINVNKMASKPTLSNVSLSFPQGTLTAVVGRVGQGKSSLLSAIIGEMFKLEGSIAIYGSVAYVPQQAWILHGSVRDNILFDKPFEQKKYDRILRACGLLPDLAILPAGDMTEIGERGINLSGGQKQRISLARAAYQDADIYLLDDPLSAVDAHVDQHLWQNLIGPDGLLSDKTRILVTHGLHHLEQVDQIVVLKDGAVFEAGQYSELMSHRKVFYQLIADYSVERKAKLKEQKKEQKKQKKSDTKENGTESDGSTETVGSDATQQKSNDPPSPTTTGSDRKTGNNNGALTSEESVSVGLAGWRHYAGFVRAGGYGNFILAIFLYAIAQLCHVGTNLWLKKWINDVQGDKSTGATAHGPGYYLALYGILVFLFVVMDIIVHYVTNVIARIRSAKFYHDRILHRILRLPMSFFDTTPTGRIINRFSTDINIIDRRLPTEFGDLLQHFAIIGGAILVVAFTTPAFLLGIPPAIFFYIVVQTYFIRTSSSLKKLAHVTNSPLYSHFSETLAGVSSIRVMDGARERFTRVNEERADAMLRMYLPYVLTNRWLMVRLDSLGAVLVFAAALAAVLNAETLDPALVGLALSYAISMSKLLNWMLRSISEIQNGMVSVERLDEYSQKPTEAPTETDVCLPERWPQAGHIQFIDYSTRYREDLDLVVKHISFEVHPGEKIGIVGRTGAGKSSLTLALFRIIEAANSYWAKASDPCAVSTSVENHWSHSSDEQMDGGSIVIDGVDIATVGLNHLRQHLSIIPQEPTLFAGTLRENLDPFNELSDVALWQALERAHLKDHISTLPGGLHFEVAQNGENFSVGQRSLICLARALLRDTKILVLDEATSSVDMETDELIQRTIRNEFKDRTILTIAHRIKSVMDYDKILVLEKGQLVEYDSPSSLLQQKDSLFYSLAKQAGELKR